MGKQVNLYEAKTQLSRLVEEAAKGETFIIAKGGKAMAKLVSLHESKKQPRQLGQLASGARNVDWTKWWKNWKAADKQIEADFQASAEASLTAPKRKKRRR